MRQLCLLSLALLVGSSASAQSWTIQVDAGAHDRRDTLVSVALPDGFGKQARLDEQTDSGARAVAAQVVPGKPARLYWVLRGTTRRDTTRSFRLQSGGEEAAAKGIASKDDGKALHLAWQGETFLRYNHALVQAPEGVDPIYARGGYIHPLRTPRGVLVSNDFPPKHVHHHGVWFPWTKTKFRGAPVDFWNSKKGEGTVLGKGLQGSGAGPVLGWFRARHQHVALKDRDKPEVVLEETWEVRAWSDGKQHWFDLDSVQTCVADVPLKLQKYRYGGLGFRGSGSWEGKGDACRFLTSEGRTRKDGHATRARWCAIYGKVGEAQAGITVFGHPANFRAPQGMRIHPSEPFFNFTPCQGGDFELAPGKPYRSSYRFMIFDGEADPGSCARAWTDYATPPRVRIAAR